MPDWTLALDGFILARWPTDTLCVRFQLLGGDDINKFGFPTPVLWIGREGVNR